MAASAAYFLPQRTSTHRWTIRRPASAPLREKVAQAQRARRTQNSVGHGGGGKRCRQSRFSRVAVQLAVDCSAGNVGVAPGPSMGKLAITVANGVCQLTVDGRR